MKSAKAYFNSLLSIDSNCPVDVYNHKYDREDLFRFAEAYHEERVNRVTDKDIERWAHANSLSDVTARGMMAGAKAMRDGEIKSKLMEE